MRRTASFAMCGSERGVVQGRGIRWIRRPRTGYYAAVHNVVDARSAVGMASTVVLAVVGQGCFPDPQARGRPRPRVAMMLRCISEVPERIVSDIESIHAQASRPSSLAHREPLSSTP